MNWTRKLLVPAVAGCLLAAAVPAEVPDEAEAGETASAEPEDAPAQPTRLSRLQGGAWLGRNRPVIGATVLVERDNDASRLFVTASDARGQFRVDDLPDGDYRVEVRRDGLEPVVKEQVSLKFPFRSIIELTMQPSDQEPDDTRPGPAAGGNGAERVTVRGKVVARGGEPMPGVLLRFVRLDGLVDPRRVRADTTGTFLLADLPVGEWRLEARVVGYLAIWGTLEFTRELDLHLTMVAQPPGYDPSPLELMPPERPIPPEALRTALEDEDDG